MGCCNEPNQSSDIVDFSLGDDPCVTNALLSRFQQLTALENSGVVKKLCNLDRFVVRFKLVTPTELRFDLEDTLLGAVESHTTEFDPKTETVAEVFAKVMELWSVTMDVVVDGFLAHLREKLNYIYLGYNYEYLSTLTGVTLYKTLGVDQYIKLSTCTELVVKEELLVISDTLEDDISELLKTPEQRALLIAGTVEESIEGHTLETTATLYDRLTEQKGFIPYTSETLSVNGSFVIRLLKPLEEDPELTHPKYLVTKLKYVSDLDLDAIDAIVNN